jgi:putative chitinase
MGDAFDQLGGAMIDPKIFFSHVRLNFGKLKQSQVNGFNTILSKWDELGGKDLRFLAYCLATAWHETGAAMQPISEIGKKSYFNKYEPTTRIGKALGNTKKGDGYLFRGRGFVQITGRSNFAKYGIANTPDKALEPDTAARILIDGMTKGVFTGRKLSDYFTDKKADPVGARAVVNGSDQAGLISVYHAHFLVRDLCGSHQLGCEEAGLEPSWTSTPHEIW